jgi:hypothetical protein
MAWWSSRFGSTCAVYSPVVETFPGGVESGSIPDKVKFEKISNYNIIFLFN